jgi:hypothetical protein
MPINIKKKIPKAFIANLIKTGCNKFDLLVELNAN